MIDLLSFYCTVLPGLCVLFLFFCFVLLLVSYNCDIWVFPSWVYPSTSLPTWLFLFSYFTSLSFTLSLTPISVVSKNLSSGATVFLFANKPASHFLLAWAYHVTPSFLSFLTSFLRSLLHLWYLVYRCSTVWTNSLHHQHWDNSIFPILAKYMPTILCPTLNWLNRTTYFFATFLITGWISAFVHEI